MIVRFSNDIWDGFYFFETLDDDNESRRVQVEMRNGRLMTPHYTDNGDEAEIPSEEEMVNIILAQGHPIQL